jgi:hypothetical protein
MDSGDIVNGSPEMREPAEMPEMPEMPMEQQGMEQMQQGMHPQGMPNEMQ